MTLDIQFKIKDNQMYQNFIREDSYWYKTLTRTPSSFKKFEESAKKKYGVRPSDQIGKLLTTIEMITSIVSTLK